MDNKGKIDFIISNKTLPHELSPDKPKTVQYICYDRKKRGHLSSDCKFPKEIIHNQDFKCFECGKMDIDCQTARI